MNESEYKKREIATGIDLGIRSEKLITDDISQMLSVEPTLGYQKGHSYIGREKANSRIIEVRRTRAFGVWHFCTSQFMESDNLDELAQFLIVKFNNAKEAIHKLLENPDYSVIISIWYVGEGRFCIKSDLLAQLASMCEEVCITTWEQDEVVD